MALIPCPECHKEVSTEARSCPQCAYPFPGKKVSQAGHPTGRLNTCPQCHGPISQHVQSCPHCGVRLLRRGQGHQRNEEESIQETLVCPHCKESYIHTRKVPQTMETGTGSKGSHLPLRKSNLLKNIGIHDSHLDTSQDEPALQESQGRRPLWQDPSAIQKVISPHPRHSKKQSIMVALILLLIVAMSVVFGAMWQLEGLNPLETILYWRM